METLTLNTTCYGKIKMAMLEKKVGALKVNMPLTDYQNEIIINYKIDYYFACCRYNTKI